MNTKLLPACVALLFIAMITVPVMAAPPATTGNPVDQIFTFVKDIQTTVGTFLTRVTSLPTDVTTNKNTTISIDETPPPLLTVTPSLTMTPSPALTSSLKFGTGCSRPGLTNCTGDCVDLSADIGNCGACGNACSSPQQCINGGCTVTCRVGETVCNGVACRNLHTDPNNCGMCGITCPSGQNCQNGVCVGAAGVSRGTSRSCMAGLTNCGDTCVNVLKDAGNCGSCGKVCSAGQTCQGGVCRGAGRSCTGGLTSCSGTCVNLQTNANNCGSCGNVCTAGHTCQGGSCKCPTGYTLCSGTCVNLQTDSDHCGCCSFSCPEGMICQNEKCRSVHGS